MKKIVVIGGRDLNDKELINQTLDSLIPINDRMLTEIHIHGSIGAEELVEDYCVYNNIVMHLHKLNVPEEDFKVVEDSNQKMLENTNHVILFWDGMSEGTGDMHERVVKGRCSHTVVYY